jgi:hypothetical protein
MRVDHGFAFGPFEDGEAAILRGHERHGVALVLDELRRGEVTGAAQWNLGSIRPPAIW